MAGTIGATVWQKDFICQCNFWCSCLTHSQFCVKVAPIWCGPTSSVATTMSVNTSTKMARVLHLSMPFQCTGLQLVTSVQHPDTGHICICVCIWCHILWPEVVLCSVTFWWWPCACNYSTLCTCTLHSGSYRAMCFKTVLWSVWIDQFWLHDLFSLWFVAFSNMIYQTFQSVTKLLTWIIIIIVSTRSTNATKTANMPNTTNTANTTNMANANCKKKWVVLTHFGYLNFILFHTIGQFH